jgi:hypothetical protein
LLILTFAPQIPQATTSYQKHPLPWQGDAQRLVLAHEIIVREMQADSRPVVLKLHKAI